MKSKYNGKVIRDTVTGLEGVCAATLLYMNGCVQYSIQPQFVKEGVPAEPKWFDSEQVELVSSKKVVKGKKEPTGGPPPANMNGARLR